MAKGNGSLLLKNISGHIGKEIVVKQYGDKTVVTAYPNMPRHKPTELKKIYETRFTEAIQYAQNILRDPKLKKTYQAKLQPGQRLYNHAISEYLNQLREKDKLLLK